MCLDRGDVDGDVAGFAQIAAAVGPDLFDEIFGVDVGSNGAG